MEGLRQAILQQKDAGKAIVVLNFPNNPTGYTPGIEEGEQIIGALLEGAEAGIHIIVLVDDAYFGLFYGSSLRESLFARLVGVHSRILPIRIDGATKEEYVTGLRVGFLTFGADNEQVLEALEQKALGMIRSTISSSPHPSQSFVLHALQSPDYEVQKSEKTQIIKERAHKAMAVLESGKYHDAWEPYPFNSGYFVCLKLKTVHPELLRVHLLDAYGVGTIALNDTDLRLAIPCIEADQWEDLLAMIYSGIQELQQQHAR
ncbi:aspartate/methionine/tyrosine aminotransferase [Paenibacillus sp. RC62]